MPKLELRFEHSVLAEYPLEMKPITIGRGHDCDVFIDNLAVSTHHARILFEDDQYVLEDNKSLNGTQVNNAKIDRCLLRDGDVISIGKHNIAFYLHAEAKSPAPAQHKVVAPSLNGTFVLETKKRVDFLKNLEEARVVAQRVQIAHLKVLDGKTNETEYVLTSQLTIIGKSEMATVRLRGWFKPKSAGVIMRRKDGYFVSPASGKVVVRINGEPITVPSPIHDGDVIEVPGAKLLFSLPQ